MQWSIVITGNGIVATQSSATAVGIGYGLSFGARIGKIVRAAVRRYRDAMADFAVSQPIFDVAPVRAFLQRYRDQFGELPIPIMGGVLPPASLRNAEFLHNELPSIILPDWTLDRMRKASDGRAEGIKIAHEALLELRECLQGVYVMPMFGRYDSAAEVIEGIP